MNFEQKEQFTVKRAGGLGAVVLFHVLLGGAVVYGLHSTTITHEPQIISKFIPPTPTTHKEEFVDKLKTDLKPITREIDKITQPVIPKGDNQEHPPEHPGLTDSGQKDGPPGTLATGEGGGGTTQGQPHVMASSPALSNLESCKPTYPMSALKSEQEGVVRVRFEIGADSRLVSAAVVKSSGYQVLDRAAVEGLSKCAFKAATQDGAPIKSSLVTDYVWSLN